ncbi:MAG: hypothetical protein LBT70_04360 [Holosporaceae bacterium]|jgi:hypothetical protein|nr:hypothetical protein [Holosporaceae bacterium]
MSFKNIFSQKWIVVCLLPLLFSHVNSMEFGKVFDELTRLKKYCNSERVDQAQAEAAYPSADRFDKSLELLSFYTNLVRITKTSSLQLFQFKALRNAIENLLEALQIADIPFHETPAHKHKAANNLSVSFSGKSSGKSNSSSSSKWKSLSSSVTAFSTSERKNENKRNLEQLQQMIKLLDQSKTALKGSLFESDDEEKKAAFLDSILKSVDAIRGISLLMISDIVERSESSSGESEPEASAAPPTNQVAPSENSRGNVEITMENLADFDEL